MKTRDFARLQKKLVPHLFPRLIVSGSFCYLPHLSDTLKGFYFESSAFSPKHFYVTAFFLPLWIPAEHIHLTFGRRVGVNQRWSSDQLDLENALLSPMRRELSILVELDLPGQLLSALEVFARGSNPHCVEALAYALFKMGQIDRSQEVLKSLLTLIDRTVPWQQEIAERAALILSFLPTGIEEVKHRLTKWRTETISALGLEKPDSESISMLFSPDDKSTPPTASGG